ncbi:MAG: TrbI/VirB10 family protein, partial [Comamonadaceae bacterium]
MVLIGAGFLFWYYSTQYSKSQDAEETARKAAAARAGGEMKVPPLGRIDPPTPPAAPAQVASVAPLPEPAPAPGGPPQKTPEQLTLERQLGAPVLRRGQSLAGAATTHSPVDATVNGQGHAGQPALPNMAQLMGAMQPPQSSGAPPVNDLASNLRPTPTPAVAAMKLPTLRMLLPKGAFIDCTLETAIDSTYPGMTTCIGATDIYGADGKVVLLERGTKYVGEQRGSPQLGQGRIFVVWNEARTPTGVVVQLASP